MKRTGAKRELNESGVSLLELMVAVAVSSIAALYISQLGMQTFSLSQQNRSQAELALFMSRIQTQFSVKGVCMDSIGGITFTSAAPVPITEPITMQKAGTTQTILDPTSDEEIAQGLRVLDAAYRLTSNNRAFLQINFGNKKGVQQVMRSIPLVVNAAEVAPGEREVTDCNVSATAASHENDITTLCYGDGSHYYNDDGEEICIHSGYSTEKCIPGHYVVGFEEVDTSPGGGVPPIPVRRPICMSIAAGVASDINCPTGQILVGINSGNPVCRVLTIDDVRDLVGGAYQDCSTHSSRRFEFGAGTVNILCP